MDRATNFKGEEINSDVIHGTDQRFTVEKLIEDLTNELENSQGESIHIHTHVHIHVHIANRSAQAQLPTGRAKSSSAIV